MSTRRDSRHTSVAIVVLTVAWLFGLAGLLNVTNPADPPGTAALLAHVAAAPDPESVEIDAAEALARIRPWHPGYAEARAHLAHIETRRLARLR